MATNGQAKGAPIKLKLSFASLAGSSSNTSNAGPSTPRQTVGGKGKGKARASDPQNIVDGLENNGHANGAETPLLSNEGRPSLHSTPVTASSTPSASRTGRQQQSTGSKTKGTKGKHKASPSTTRPTAIPPRLLSAPSTPRAPSPLSVESTADDEGSTPAETQDPSHRSTPGPESPAPVKEEAPSPSPLLPAPEIDEAEQRARQAARIQKLKRPLREHINKILVELNRKDEYLLFCEPVRLDEFPDYLNIIGGAENMMDFETMQRRADDGEYRSLDPFEADLRTLVTAAQTFNPPGSIPYGSATKILNLGLKQIEKARPLVRTPSPSPPRRRSSRSDVDTPERGTTVVSTREGTAPPRSNPAADVPPEHYIPEEMLLHPPNSMTAKAVGWSLNGGKRQWTKRQLKGRERFVGKWRHWTLDGSRDLAELDDVTEWFAAGETVNGETSSWKPDWKNIRKDPNWWEVDIGGPMGQPPFPFTPYPHPYRLRRHEYEQFDWGVYPEVIAEGRLLGSRTNQPEHVALEEHLRPAKFKPKPSSLAPANFVDVYDGHLDVQAQDALSSIVYGDTVGEAYFRSIEAFISGAQQMAKDGGEAVKVEEEGDRVELDEWVKDNWHGGIMKSKARSIVRDTLQEVAELRDTLAKGLPLSDRQQTLYKVAKGEYTRHALRAITRPTNPLDIACLLVEQSDFLWSGVGGRSGVREGLLWTGNEIARLSKEIAADAEQNGDPSRKRKLEADEVDPLQDLSVKKLKQEDATAESAASSPLSQAPESPAKEAKDGKAEDADAPTDRATALRKLRLELIALSKFYPLAALKKMDKSEAERLLPKNVRALMSKK